MSTEKAVGVSPAITENIVERTSIPNGCIGVCVETREILLGAGIGNEPYRLYTDRLRILESLESLLAQTHHDENDIVSVLDSKTQWFYQWHCVEDSSYEIGDELGHHLSADIGWWQFIGKISLDIDLTKYARKPSEFKEGNFAIFDSTGNLLDAGTNTASYVLDTLFRSHVLNTNLHVTKALQDKWTAKQDALTADQMKAVNSGFTSSDKEKFNKVPESDWDKLLVGATQDNFPIEVVDHKVNVSVSYQMVSGDVKGDGTTVVVHNLDHRTMNVVGSRVISSTGDRMWTLYDESGTDTEWCLRPVATLDSDLRHYECEIAGKTAVIRQYKEYDELWWQFTYDGRSSFTNADLETAVDWVFSDPIPVSGKVIKGCRAESAYWVQNEVEIHLPKINPGYTRDLFVTVRPTGTDPTKFWFSVEDGDTLIYNPRFLDVEVADGEKRYFGKGVYRILEIAPNVLLLDYAESDWIVDYCKTRGSVTNPFEFPLHVMHNGNMYKIEVYDDDDGIGLSVEKVTK